MNKYLEKIANQNQKGIPGTRDFLAGWKRSSTTSKIGLGMSAVGLGMGIANYNNSVQNLKHNQAKSDMDAKSLAALHQIATTLKKPAKVVMVEPKGMK